MKKNTSGLHVKAQWMGNALNSQRAEKPDKEIMGALFNPARGPPAPERVQTEVKRDKTPLKQPLGVLFGF